MGAEEAAASARRLLDAFRESGAPIVHLQHVSGKPGATFMLPGSDGFEIHEMVAPATDELVITKGDPDGFVGTSLEDELRRTQTGELVIAGMMSNMCVNATVRAAVELGFATTVVHDVCAAADLQFRGSVLPGATVHAVSMASLADGYATVVSAGELLSD